MNTRDLQRWRDVLERREAGRGLLVAFEGPDGSGTTTQCKLFKTWLKSQGTPVRTTKWNSSRLIKPLVRAREEVHALSPEESCFLHAADFRHRLDTEVLPALWQGTTVAADRYLFAALARDTARELPIDWLLNVYAPILWPDVVFCFALSPDTQFISRVIREYESRAMSARFVTIDAERSIDEQHREIREHYQQLPRLSWPDWNIEPVAEWLAHHPATASLEPNAVGRRQRVQRATSV